MSEPAAKKQRTHPQYELYYWPGVPGRGEFVRLVFEAAGVPYKDITNSASGGADKIISLLKSSPKGNPPIFAPPALLVPSAHPADASQPLLFSQTPSILSYLGPKLSLAGPSEAHQAWTQSVAFTALDLNNEVHDTHHPVATSDYYEAQKDEALKKATDFRENRIPKFFKYFESVLKENESQGKGKYMVGEGLTSGFVFGYALSLSDNAQQVLPFLHMQKPFEQTELTAKIILQTTSRDSKQLFFAFPKELAHRQKSNDFSLLFGTFQPGIKEEKGIKEYLASDRRPEYSNGIFRHYPELDRP
ncbi:MAG: hypothetical protein Q9227_005918 [Pyrenula ochraceoflavens]